MLRSRPCQLMGIYLYSSDLPNECSDSILLLHHLFSFEGCTPHHTPHPTNTPHPTRPHPIHPPHSSQISQAQPHPRSIYYPTARPCRQRFAEEKEMDTHRMTPVISLSTQCVGSYLLAIPMLGASPGRTLCLTLCLCVLSVPSGLFLPWLSWLVRRVACGGHAAELCSVQDSRAEKGKEKKK